METIVIDSTQAGIRYVITVADGGRYCLYRQNVGASNWTRAEMDVQCAQEALCDYLTYADCLTSSVDSAAWMAARIAAIMVKLALIPPTADAAEIEGLPNLQLELLTKIQTLTNAQAALLGVV